MKQIRRLLGAIVLSAAATLPAIAQTAEDFKPYKPNNLRLPSVPILINDPFFSIWSNYDNLNGGSTRHWSEKEKAMPTLENIIEVAPLRAG